MPLNTPWSQNGGHGWEDVATSVPAAPKPSGSRAYTMDVTSQSPADRARPPALPTAHQAPVGLHMQLPGAALAL